MTSTKTEMEKRLYNFYGTARYGRAEFHPSERMSESEEFKIEFKKTYEDGELLWVEDVNWKKVHAELTARAKELLALWPDQPAILVREWDGGYFTVYRD